MPDREIEIGVKSVGTETTASEVRDVKDAMTEMGDSVTATSDKLESSTGDTNAATTAATSLADAIEKVDTSLDTLSTEPLEKQKTAIDKVDDALEKAGDQYKKMAQDADVSADKTRDALAEIPEGVRASLTQAQAAVDKFFDKFKEGKAREGDLNKLWKTQELLRIELERSGKEVKDFGEAAQRVFKDIDKRTDEARDGFRRMDDALDAGKRTVIDAQDSWVGLKEGIASTMGKYGEAAIAIGIATAALKETWDIWKKVEEATGQNNRGVETFTGLLEQLGVTLRDTGLIAQNLFADMIADATNAGLALTGIGDSTLKASTSIKSLSDDVVKFHAFMLTGKEGAEIFSAAVAGGASQMDALKLSLDFGEAAGNAFDLAMQKGAAGVELWRKAVADSHGDSDLLKQKMEELTPVLQGMADAADNSAEALARQAEAQKKATDEIKSYVTEAQKKSGIDQSFIDTTKQLIHGNEASMQGLETYADVIRQFLPEAEKHSVLIEKTAQKMESQLKNTDGLTVAERKRLEGIIAQAKNVDTLTSSEKAKLEQDLASIGQEKELAAARQVTTKVLEDGTVKIQNAAAEQGKLNQTVEQGRTKYTNLGQGVTTATDAIADGTAKFTTFGPRVNDADTAIKLFNESMEKSSGFVHAQAEAIERLNSKLSETEERLNSVAKKFAEIGSEENA